MRSILPSLIFFHPRADIQTLNWIFFREDVDDFQHVCTRRILSFPPRCSVCADVEFQVSTHCSLARVCFTQALKLLVKSLDNDLLHVRLHSLILGRASEWQKRDYEKSLLLMGAPTQKLTVTEVLMYLDCALTHRFMHIFFCTRFMQYARRR